MKILFIGSLILSIIILSCSGIKVADYKSKTNGIGLSLQVPMWKPTQMNVIKDTINKTVFKYDSVLMINCDISSFEFLSKAKKILEEENFSVLYIDKSTDLNASRKYPYQFGKNIDLNINIYFDRPIFQHSKYISFMNLKLMAFSQDINPVEIIKPYSNELLSKLCKNCIKPNVAAFGAVPSGKRTPKTKDEERIFEKFGEKGLRAIDYIDGIHTIEEIMNNSGMNKNEINNLFDFLLKNNYIEYK